MFNEINKILNYLIFINYLIHWIHLIKFILNLY